MSENLTPIESVAQINSKIDELEAKAQGFIRQYGAESDIVKIAIRGLDSQIRELNAELIDINIHDLPAWEGIPLESQVRENAESKYNADIGVNDQKLQELIFSVNVKTNEDMDKIGLSEEGRSLTKEEQSLLEQQKTTLMITSYSSVKQPIL
jgi:hypothetical protein